MNAKSLDHAYNVIALYRLGHDVPDDEAREAQNALLRFASMSQLPERESGPMRVEFPGPDPLPNNLIELFKKLINEARTEPDGGLTLRSRLTKRETDVIADTLIAEALRGSL